MKKLGTFLVIAVAAIGLSAAGCKKKKENAGGGSGRAAVSAVRKCTAKLMAGSLVRTSQYRNDPAETQLGVIVMSW